MIRRNNKKNNENSLYSEFSKKNDLKIYCNNCLKKNDNFFNDSCINCILQELHRNQNEKINSIILESFNFRVERELIMLFFEYFNILDNLQSKLKKLFELKSECNFKEFRCEIFNKISAISNKINSNLNPITTYKHILTCESDIQEYDIKTYCKDCYLKVQKEIGSIRDKMEILRIIKKYENFKSKSDLYNKYLNFYQFLFSNFVEFSAMRKGMKQGEESSGELIYTYSIQKFGTYSVFIYRNKNEIEKRYFFKHFFTETVNKEYYGRIINYTYKKLEMIKLEKILSIEDLIDSYYFEAIKQIDEKFDLPNITKKKLALLVAIRIINLDNIFPLLLDDYIEEIFLDSPDDKIYLNHQKFGRCRTSISFNKSEIDRIITLFRLYSGKRLDYSNPNLKFVLKNKFFYCRFTCDIFPINSKGFSLDIRKLNKDIFTIQDLLKNETINSKIASFLYFCVLKNINITVTGRTDSGKTTLINSLDLLTPKEFRKIYIENAIESLDQILYGKHQLKFKVNSLSENIDIQNKKSGQIKKLLHRTPDLIYLGEILTKEECDAMFHCLSVGLRGFQTIHSNDINSLINRFLYHFKIEKSCLNDLDILILMKKDENGRRKVVSINQIIYESSYLDITPIFEYEPDSESWLQKTSLFSLHSIRKIRRFEALSEEKFEFLINILQGLFNYLKQKDRFSLTDLISFFDKISYLSKISLERLAIFKDSIM
jgi:flagellar protein FlaI